MTFSDQLITIAESQPDYLLTERQVARVLAYRNCDLSDYYSEIPPLEANVGRSAEYLLAWLGY